VHLQWQVRVFRVGGMLTRGEGWCAK